MGEEKHHVSSQEVIHAQATPGLTLKRGDLLTVSMIPETPVFVFNR